MRKLMNKKSGFTLIELMIVVAILGILAAIAIPAFVTYIRRAKTVEATENVSKMFDAAASYYAKERVAPGITASSQIHCTVADDDDGKDPGTDKIAGSYEVVGEGFNKTNGIGFSVGPAYYRYELDSTPGDACNNGTSADLYALRALGDLDGDNVSSTFQLSAGTSADNELYHARGFYIHNETE
jgi:type IV pilus assembly protein PilA